MPPVPATRAMGTKNKLLFCLLEALKVFKAPPPNNPIIVGRRPWRAFPEAAFPSRRNIVLSRTQTCFPGCDVYASLDEALTHCSKDEDIYIIGGASVYEQALPIADRLCLTEVEDTPADADAFFPAYDKGWKLDTKEQHEIDERHHQRFAFADYVRRSEE